MDRATTGKLPEGNPAYFGVSCGCSRLSGGLVVSADAEVAVALFVHLWGLGVPAISDSVAYFLFRFGRVNRLQGKLLQIRLAACKGDCLWDVGAGRPGD